VGWTVEGCAERALTPNTRTNDPSASPRRRRIGLPPICSPFLMVFILDEFRVRRRESASNKSKHGIDFVEAQALWNDPDRIEGPGRSIDEPRFQVVGQTRQNDLDRDSDVSP
jgi:hypothetical protein